ncbi:MAG: START domain-containing protein [Salinivirgaceae bacterium]
MNSIAQENAGKWIFFKESNDITVYFRTAEKSNIKELKLTTTINATVQTVQSIITNVDLLHTWGYGCVESKLLKRVGTGELYYYYVADVPWPISDRDVVIHMKISHDSISGVTNINSMNYNGMIPEKEDRTRVQYVRAHWQLTPIKKDLMQLDFMISSDLGSNFPDWLVNYAMSYSPIKSMIALKEIVNGKK